MNKFNHLYNKIIKEDWEDPADFENSPLPELKKVLTHLLSIQNTRDDRTRDEALKKIDLEVLWTGSDDTGGMEDEDGNEIENSANVTINGVRFAFWWVDDLSFLNYWREDEQSFADLITAVESVIAAEEEN